MPILTAQPPLREAVTIIQPITLVGAHVQIIPNTAQTITVPAGAQGIMMEAFGTGGVRLTLDGTTPTSTLGFVVGNNQLYEFDFYESSPLILKVIGVTTGNTLDYQFFKHC